MCELHSHLAICFWGGCVCVGSSHAGERILFIITDDSGNKTDVEPTCSLISSLYSSFRPIQTMLVPVCPTLLHFHTKPSAVGLFAHEALCTSRWERCEGGDWDCELVWPRMYDSELFWKLLRMTAWLIMEMQFTNFLMMLYTRLSFITDLTANTHLCARIDG